MCGVWFQPGGEGRFQGGQWPFQLPFEGIGRLSWEGLEGKKESDDHSWGN